MAQAVKKGECCMISPTYILTADWHLREDTPVCRTDDFVTTQFRKMDFVADLQRKYCCPVLHAGDLFHKWKPSPWLISKTIEHLPEDFYTVLGNHDLPYHKVDEWQKCGVFTLFMAGSLHVLPFGHYGAPFKRLVCNNEHIDRELDYDDVFVLHQFVCIGNEGYTWTTPSDTVKALFRNEKLKRFKLLLTGDNHIPFTRTTTSGRLLVNPGPLTRQTVKDHAPRVYLYYHRTNEIRPVWIPCEDDAVDDSHIVDANNRDNRLDAFVEGLDTDWERGGGFLVNLRNYRKKNKVSDKVWGIIERSVEVE